MRRQQVIVGLGVLVLASAVGVVLWLRQPRPCLATFERVREGMSLEEVCSTVGGQPGDYTGGRSLHWMIHGESWGPRESGEMWAAEDATLWIRFDHDGRAAALEVERPILLPPPPLLDRLRARLGF